MKTSTILLLSGVAGLAFFLYSRKASAGENYSLDLPESLSDLMQSSFKLDPWSFDNPWDATSLIPSPVIQPVQPNALKPLDYFSNPDLVDSILNTGSINTGSASTGASYVLKQWKTPAVGETAPGKFGPEKVVYDGTKYDDLFRAAEVKNGIPYGTLSRMAWQESRYNPSALSPVGAVGLMQIMPATAKGYNVAAVDLKTPKTAIDLAGKILKDFYNTIKPAAARSWPAAIVAYNQGPGNVNRAIAEKGPMILDWINASNIGPDGRGYYQIAVDVGLAPAGIGANMSSANVAGVNNRLTKRGNV